VSLITKLKNAILTQRMLLFKYQPLLLLVHAYTCTPTLVVQIATIPSLYFLEVFLTVSVFIIIEGLQVLGGVKVIISARVWPQAEGRLCKCETFTKNPT
jgi:hypothetical protein